VLSRAVGGRLDAFSAAELQAIADASVPPDRPGHWTHALMDVGATFCKPRAPRCGACPAREWCRSALRGTAEEVGATQSKPRAAREAPATFASTSRWLRGRILDRLRDASQDSWARIDGPLGDHDERAVRSALDDLAREGLAERHPSDPTLARLPTA
jgi:A/G-specific adenine glycosylase